MPRSPMSENSPLSETLQDRAALYVTCAMPAEERDSFEVLLDFHRDLRQLVASLQEAVNACTLASAGVVSAVPPRLKSRLMGRLEAMPPPAEPDSLVVTDAEGRIEWFNAAFTAMCGYSLPELRGRKPGHVLQGPGTDPATAARIRAAITARQACHETVVNYHKSGARYEADIRISPILDDDRQPLWFVARERKLRAAKPLAN
jgi:PAS domain S-box-containing protein